MNKSFKDVVEMLFLSVQEHFKNDGQNLMKVTEYEISDYLDTLEELLSSIKSFKEDVTSKESRIYFGLAYLYLDSFNYDNPFNNKVLCCLIEKIFPEWLEGLSGCWTIDRRLGYYCLMFSKLYYDYSADLGEYKVFISLPFTGVEDTLGERFEEAKRVAYETFTDSERYVTLHYQDNISELIKTKKSGNDYPYYMGKDIEKILSSDALLIGSGWENSKGCQLEHKAAELFNIKIEYIN